MGVWPEELDERPLIEVDYMTRHLLDSLTDPKWISEAPFGGEFNPDPNELPPGYADLPVEE